MTGETVHGPWWISLIPWAKGHFAWPRHQTDMCQALPEASCGWRIFVMPKWVTDENDGANVPFRILLSIYLSIPIHINLSLSVSLSLFFSTYLSIYLSVYLSIYLSTLYTYIMYTWLWVKQLTGCEPPAALPSLAAHPRPQWGSGRSARHLTIARHRVFFDDHRWVWWIANMMDDGDPK